MVHLFDDLEAAFGKELGRELAIEVAASIRKASDGSLEAMRRMFFGIGMEWSTVLRCWREWIKENAAFRPVLMMRDAEPLTVIPASSAWPVAWLNRKNCGIEDELSGDEAGKMNGLMHEYIRQEKLDRPFTFVDGGAWGTIVEELHGLGLRFQPLFFYSHNPNIPGFLNELGLGKKDGELLNDSLECSFLKSFQRPESFVKDGMGIVRPQLLPATKEIALFSRATLDGVKAGIARNACKDPLAAAERLLSLSRKASETGSFTGILPRNSPTWSNGEAFLANWPKGLKWT